MADKRKKDGKKTKRKDDDQVEEKPTKEEYAVAKFMRFNVPIREGRLVGMTVKYFIASKAVDALMETKWAGSKGQADVLFKNRTACVNYCDRLLAKGMFHRAARVERSKKEKKKKKKESEEDEVEEDKEKDKKKKKEKKTKKDKKEPEKEKDKENEAESDKDSDKSKKKETEKEKAEEEKKDDDKKKKKKVKLEMHNNQLFEDGDEIYVWIYDPVPVKTFLIGLLLVLGAIGVCLFPLWPPEVRLGVYYLSLTAAGFVGFILVLCVVRFILFCLIWVCTFGKHHFWLLPNLTEDVGFFDSFKPLYHHTVCDNEKTDGKENKSTEEDSSEKEKLDSKKDKSKDPKSEQSENEEGKGDSEKEETGSEENGDNGYELIQKDEIEESKKDK